MRKYFVLACLFLVGMADGQVFEPTHFEVDSSKILQPTYDKELNILQVKNLNGDQVKLFKTDPNEQLIFPWMSYSNAYVFIASADNIFRYDIKTGAKLKVPFKSYDDPKNKFKDAKRKLIGLGTNDNELYYYLLADLGNKVIPEIAIYKLNFDSKKVSKHFTIPKLVGETLSLTGTWNNKYLSIANEFGKVEIFDVVLKKKISSFNLDLPVFSPSGNTNLYTYLDPNNYTFYFKYSDYINKSKIVSLFNLKNKKAIYTEKFEGDNYNTSRINRWQETKEIKNLWVRDSTVTSEIVYVPNYPASYTTYTKDDKYRIGINDFIQGKNYLRVRAERKRIIELYKDAPNVTFQATYVKEFTIKNDLVKLSKKDYQAYTATADSIKAEVKAFDEMNAARRTTWKNMTKSGNGLWVKYHKIYNEDFSKVLFSFRDATFMLLDNDVLKVEYTKGTIEYYDVNTQKLIRKKAEKTQFEDF